MISDVFREDIAEIVSSPEIRWDDMKNTSVLVTGATGLIGSALVYALSSASVKHGLRLNIRAHGRNIVKGAALAKDCVASFISSDIREPISKQALPTKIDYIFHCASFTKSAEMVAKPVDVISTAVNGTSNILELAVERQCKSVVFLSSMEVYGQLDKKKVTESDLGRLSLSDPRSSYPESKRLCEALCTAYAAQYKVPVKSARLAQTFGAGTPNDDTRVFAQFARSAISGTNIELYTEGKSKGNYCYTSDTIRALMAIALKGKDGEAYNVANPKTSMTIRDMANLVACEVCGGRIEVVVKIPEDIAKRGYAPDAGYSLNVDKLKALGWIPQYGLSDMYRRTIADWLQNSK